MPTDSQPILLVLPGRTDYSRALDIQHRLHDLRTTDRIPDILVLLEHPAVVTIGKHGKRANLLVSDEELEHRGIRLVRVERGGDITCHGPGQLVGYPVFRLTSGVVGVRRFVELVQEAVVTGLGRLGVRARTREGYVGVWVDDRKIASIGIAVRRGVAFHGFALNVSTELGLFNVVNPCGMEGVVMTSVEQEGGDADWLPAVRAISSGFEDAFGVRFQRNLPRSLTSLTKEESASAMLSASDFE